MHFSKREEAAASVPKNGGIAQLGEHLPCKQGVKGSNPFISIAEQTAFIWRIAAVRRHICFLRKTDGTKNRAIRNHTMFSKTAETPKQ